MNGVFIRGIGAVSPAGWGVEAMLTALRAGVPGPTQPLSGSLPDHHYPVRLVPSPLPRPSWLAHPRLRRASAISHFAIGAALEAMQPWLAGQPAAARMGIVIGTHIGGIRYSERFYGEVLQNPTTASPMLFPETVINAPASHLAAFLGHAGLVYSVVGDQTAFVQALLVACQWLLDDRVDTCLVLGVEEADWTVADALRRFARDIVPSEGAGALLLAREPGDGLAVALERITDALLYAGASTKTSAARAMRGQLPDANSTELLADARCGVSRVDRAETGAWADWTGARISPRVVLGEGLSAATAWQFIAAHAALADGSATAANLSVVGGNQEAIGARLIRVDGLVSRSPELHP